MWVQPTKKAGQRVVLWERDKRHPGGEIFIAGNQNWPHEVFLTLRVQEKLETGLLVEVNEPMEHDSEGVGYKSLIKLDVKFFIGLAKEFFQGEGAVFKLGRDYPSYEVNLLSRWGTEIPDVNESALLSFVEDDRTYQAQVTAVKRPNGCQVTVEPLNNGWSYIKPKWEEFILNLERQGWSLADTADGQQTDTAVPKQPEPADTEQAEQLQESPATDRDSRDTPTTLTLPQVSALGKLISDNFTPDELRELTASLDIDYDVLRGDNKSGKAQDLADYARRHGKVADLWDKLYEERSHVDWSQALR